MNEVLEQQLGAANGSCVSGHFETFFSLCHNLMTVAIGDLLF